MTNEKPGTSSRREFLTGSAARSEIERAIERQPEEAAASERAASPAGGSTVRLATRAMACDFAVLMNPGPSERVMAASEALEHVHALESQMTVYRDDSELSRLNRRAARQPVPVEPGLFALLVQARDLSLQTEGAFDPTSGPLIDLWRRCRREARIPADTQIAECLKHTGIDKVCFDTAAGAVRFFNPGVELNLGGIGKGHALDRAGAVLAESGGDNWLLHGGQSSILARGVHNATGGWPVGIRNPLFPTERLATVVLKNCALSTSGSGVQHFRYGGRRYGHILDPRTGLPVEGMLSVTVVAPTAAVADALSTAFFVAGVEKAREYCNNHKGIGALIIPPARRGRKLEPIVCRIPQDVLFFESENIAPQDS